MTQFCSTNESIAITIKHLEGLDQLLLCVCILHLSCHQGQKFREINCTISVRIDFIYHVL